MKRRFNPLIYYVYIFILKQKELLMEKTVETIRQKIKPKVNRVV
jgi:hypothetical protein